MFVSTLALRETMRALAAAEAESGFEGGTFNETNAHHSRTDRRLVRRRWLLAVGRRGWRYRGRRRRRARRGQLDALRGAYERARRESIRIISHPLKQHARLSVWRSSRIFLSADRRHPRNPARLQWRAADGGDRCAGHADGRARPFRISGRAVGRGRRIPR